MLNERRPSNLDQILRYLPPEIREPSEAQWCQARVGVRTSIYEVIRHRCTKRADHPDDHASEGDVLVWSTTAICTSKVAVKRNGWRRNKRVYSNETCGLISGHPGQHRSSNGLEWTPDQALPLHIPQALALVPRKRTLWTIVREFFGRHRHIRDRVPKTEDRA